MTNPIRKDIHNSSIPVVCQACEARHKGVCGALTPDQLTLLSKHTSKKVYQSSEELYSTTEEQTKYSNILSGVVKLSKLMPDGRQQIVGLQFAPDFLGRPFAKQNSVIAEAATDVRLCSFPKAVLEDIMSQAPEMEHRLHNQTLKELDEAREWMLTLGRKSAMEKVASFLYMIATHAEPERNDIHRQVVLDLPMKRADIADFLGLTIETVSRQLTNLRKAGLIEIENRRIIIIPDLSALHDAAEQDLA